jgi:hypothetical protein
VSLVSPRSSSSSPEPDRSPSLFVDRLRELALQALERMYRRSEGLFAFRLRRTREGVALEGSSRRYTAITAIGLAGEHSEDAERILGGSLASLDDRLLQDVAGVANLGDVALTLWAAALLDRPGRGRALERIVALAPLQGARPTVELAWTLAALCLDPARPAEDLREGLAARLRDSFNAGSSLFPHAVGGVGGLRSHVCCFADLVYPIQALSFHARLTGNRVSRSVAGRCAERICRAQGGAGQWWWHYDVRDGAVVEGYPVYAVHQDGMAPMALNALRECGGGDFGEHAQRGLDWLEAAPELDGGTLVDAGQGVIWRKVARREPGKLSRSLQALASRLDRGLRAPGLDRMFPPVAVDHESRPYHMGWLLHAYPARPGVGW